MLNRLKDWVNSNNLVLVIILLYVLLSVVKLEHPGVNNDQLMFVNSATLNPDNMFLWSSFKGIPTMVFPYIGALKSYIYMPIFFLFGVDIYTIRIPQILMIAAALYFLYKALRRVFNQTIALLGILFLSLDPSLIAYSRVDFGPVVVEFLLKVLSVYLLTLFLESRKLSILFLTYFVLGLGIFNKINFFWFVNAFLISFVLVFGKRFYNDFKGVDKLYPLVIVLVPYIILLRFFVKLSKEVTANYKDFSNEISVSNVFLNLPIFLNNFVDIISGNQFYRMVYGEELSRVGIIYVVLIMIITFGGGVLYLRREKSESKNYFLFIGGIIVLLLGQMLLTKRAVAAWHTLSLYPLFTILFVVGIYQIGVVISRKMFKRIFIVLVLGFLVYLASISFLYISSYSKPTKAIAWTSSIYDLVKYVRGTPNRYLCIDIGICHQLTSLTQSAGKYQEPSYEKPLILGEEYKDYYYITHGESNSYHQEFRAKFFEYIAKNNLAIQKIIEFRDGGIITFEIYKVIK